MYRPQSGHGQACEGKGPRKPARTGSHCSRTIRWAKWAACGLPQGVKASVLGSNHTEHLFR